MAGPTQRPPRRPPDEPPPFLGTWGNVYLFVAIELFVLVGIFYAITRWFW